MEVNFTFGGEGKEDQLSGLAKELGGEEQVTVWKAPVDKGWASGMDPEFRIDGNAIISRFSETKSNQKDFTIVSHQVLRFSEQRTAHRLLLRCEKNNRYVSFVNLHLHHMVEDPEIRNEQVLTLGKWLEERDQEDFSQIRSSTAKRSCIACCYNSSCRKFPEYTIVVGDYNSPPNEPAYHSMKQMGFLSAHELFHGKEPESTFPSGLQAPTMDTDEPGTFDYIFIKTCCSPLVSQYEIVSVSVGANQPLPDDPTMYPSDHLSISAQFVIS